MATASKCIPISSKDRLDQRETASSAFRIAVPRDFHSGYAVATLSRCIPFTSHRVITADNNCLDIDDGRVWSISIPSGTYDISTLTSVIQSVLNAGSTGFIVTHSITTGAVSITAPLPFRLLFGSGANRHRSICRLLGFEAVDTTLADEAVGTYAVFLTQPLITIPEIGTPHVTPQGWRYTFQPGGLHEVPLRRVRVTGELNVLLHGQSGMPVDLSGIEWATELHLHIGYAIETPETEGFSCVIL